MRAAEIKECCGCGNCEVACPLGAVRLVLDNEGFYMPKVDEKKCVNCKKCVAVCPVTSNIEILKTQFAQKSFYGQAKDLKLRASVTSGGIATLLAISIIHKGGIVYGSVYKNNYRDVVVERVDKIEDIEKLKGSKYTQSIKQNTFKNIKNDLEKKLQVLYVGLPCEIAALKAYLQKKYTNLLTVDLVCHGPTSTYALRDYVDYYSSKKVKDIEFFSMRYKVKGKWTPYYIYLQTSKKIHKEIFWGSDFGYVFGRFARQSCYNCKFKNSNRYSDITLGDAWGMPKDAIFDDNTGISAILVNSSKGYDSINALENIVLVEGKSEDILRGNPNLVTNRKYNKEREIISRNLKKYGLKKTVTMLKPLKRRICDKIYNIKVQLLDI